MRHLPVPTGRKGTFSNCSERGVWSGGVAALSEGREAAPEALALPPVTTDRKDESNDDDFRPTRHIPYSQAA